MEYRELIETLSDRACNYAFMYSQALESKTAEGVQNVAFAQVESLINNFMTGDKLYSLFPTSNLSKQAKDIFGNSDLLNFVQGLKNYTLKGTTNSELIQICKEMAQTISMGVKPIKETNALRDNPISIKETPENSVSIASIEELLLCNTWVIPLIMLGGSYAIFIIMITNERDEE